MVAEKYDNDILWTAVVEHLVKWIAGKKSSYIPGYDQVVSSQEKPIAELLNDLASKVMLQETEIKKLEEKIIHLFGNLDSSPQIFIIENELFHLHVIWNPSGQECWDRLDVRGLDVVQTVLERVHHRCRLSTSRSHLFTKKDMEQYRVKYGNDYLDRQCTLAYYGIIWRKPKPRPWGVPDPLKVTHRDVVLVHGDDPLHLHGFRGGRGRGMLM